MQNHRGFARLTAFHGDGFMVGADKGLYIGFIVDNRRGEHSVLRIRVAEQEEVFVQLHVHRLILRHRDACGQSFADLDTADGGADFALFLGLTAACRHGDGGFTGRFAVYCAHVTVLLIGYGGDRGVAGHPGHVQLLYLRVVAGFQGGFDLHAAPVYRGVGLQRQLKLRLARLNAAPGVAT